MGSAKKSSGPDGGYGVRDRQPHPDSTPRHGYLHQPPFEVIPLTEASEQSRSRVKSTKQHILLTFVAHLQRSARLASTYGAFESLSAISFRVLGNLFASPDPVVAAATNQQCSFLAQNPQGFDSCHALKGK